MSSHHQDTCCCGSTDNKKPLYNRPGKDTLDYRIGTFHTFLKEMKERISTWETPAPTPKRAIKPLTTREADDPSIALMDAWAVVGDIMTFYQERIANEGFLRTAEERQSLLELARQIGYELKPGVAASTVLCWTLVATDAAPDIVDIPAGTQVQSIPSGGDLPQTFETGEDFTAYRDWNAITLRLTTPLSSSDVASYLADGLGLLVRPGDAVLIDTGGSTETRFVQNVKENPDSKTTLITFYGKSDSALSDAEWPDFPPAPELSPGSEALDLTEEDVSAYIFSKTITEKQFARFCDYYEWDVTEVVKICRNLRSGKEVMPDLFHYGERVSFYGSQRPIYMSLPLESRRTNPSTPDNDKAYPYPWDSDTTIWYDPANDDSWDPLDCYLDREISDIAEGRRILIRDKSGDLKAFQISDTSVASLNSYAVSAKATGLKFTNVDKSDNYTLNDSRAFAGEKQLSPSAVPLDSVVSAGTETLVLGDMILGLSIGRDIVLTGKRTDAEDYTQSELLTLKEIEHSGGYTRITFQEGLLYGYYRDSIVICANVTKATHGETVSDEVLGSSTAEAHQQFTLRKSPLTWTNASTETGAESTLTIRINGVAWKAVDSLYGTSPEDDVYTIRLTDDGDTIIQFGDGIHGAIPPAGINNIVAGYRTGIGSDGLVDADVITLIKTRPYGVNTVTNPGASDDAEDPETRDDARKNAPRTVRTLDRIVSLTDYEDFCRTYTGIGKARATEFSLDGDALIHISVLSSTGDDVSEEKLESLNKAIASARDSFIPFIVDNGQIRQVTLTAGMIIDDRYEFKEVASECTALLVDEFSFENMTFGKTIDADDIIRVLHSHDAVIAVDIDSLALAGETAASGVAAYVEAPEAHKISKMAYESAVLLVMPEIGIELIRKAPAERV